MRTRMAYLRLTRPFMSVIAGLTAALGCFFGEPTTMAVVTYVGSAIVLLTAAGFVMNDVLEVDKDRANPRKPLATGEADIRYAAVLLSFLVAIAAVLLTKVNILATVIGATQFLVLVVYSTIKAKNAIVANAVTGLLCASCFLYGAMVANAPWVNWFVPAITALLVTTARELAKDMLDVDADRVAGIRTAPIRWGVRTTSWVLLTICVAATVVIAGYVVVRGTSILPLFVLLCALIVVAPIAMVCRTEYHRRILPFVLVTNALALPTGLLAFLLVAIH